METQVVEEGIRNGHHYTVKRLPLTYAEVYTVRTGHQLVEARSKDEAASLVNKLLGEEVVNEPGGSEDAAEE